MAEDGDSSEGEEDEVGEDALSLLAVGDEGVIDNSLINMTFHLAGDFPEYTCSSTADDTYG